MTATQTRYPEAAIEADKEVPIIRITRDFRGTPAQLMKAHTDPELFVRWIGPEAISSRVIEWDVRDGGSWRYVSTHEGQEFGFRGCFHTVGEDKIVQTFTFLGMPDSVALESLWFEDLGDGTTRLHAQSLCDSFEARDGWLASGMEVGVNEGYAALDGILAAGEV
ncbi:SRPBCC family protein [Gordonia sp. NPDC058843]|uniref:SRPBCC family protein n=1 Tax=Gordonia sp. NPDC058843 TaxID=3346648 RepID=UPI003698BD7C